MPIQMTLVQIDNYGPWTESLGVNREADLQILQGELYTDLQRLFSVKGGLLFYSRFDNMIAVTNGIGHSHHDGIIKSIQNRYPITISMGVGIGKDPLSAQNKASKLLQEKGSAQSKKRKSILAHNGFLSRGEGMVHMVHADIDDFTRNLTDSVSAYEAFLKVNEIFLELSKRFLKKKALVFFTGGDNFLIVCNGISNKEIEEILMDVSEGLGLTIIGAFGRGKTALEALRMANQGLHLSREGKVKGILVSTTY
ncbi:MAG: GTP cyclohydrolase IIa [Candidatus Wukongarchaeota archaeon]|nr:GTP cyclohydrolase IIa [Candidatus Wukongarchaeota archaeon]